VFDRRRVNSWMLCWACVCGFIATTGGMAAADTCPNQSFRVGASANLPDCRAYELVTPPNMNGLRPDAANYDANFQSFNTSALSSNSQGVIFHTLGGTLPGFDGTGFTDRYRAVRGPSGWTTELFAPTGSEARLQYPGGIDPDSQAYFLADRTINTDGNAGSLLAELGGQADLLRTPKGEYELIGRGEIAGTAVTSRWAQGLYISPGAGHIIFSSASRTFGLDGEEPVRLADDAPPAGTAAIYDRGLTGPTSVVSLLPGNAVPAAGENAKFLGASKDGTAVAFRIQGDPSIYVRLDNAVTETVTNAASTFAGLSSDGGQVFYANAADPETSERDQTPADLFSFDTASTITTQITSVDDARFANVSEDGSHVYFVAETPIGGEGTAGQPNLYVWDRDTTATTFIGTLDPVDVTVPEPPGVFFGGSDMVRWTSQVTEQTNRGNYVGPGKNNSRSNPGGTVLVFQSRAKLTSAENNGHSAIYRYDSATAAEPLICISCPSDATPSQADSTLQDVFRFTADNRNPVSAPYKVSNVTDDGNTVFFQSFVPLVPADTGPGQDIYEWEAPETGGCAGNSGCLHLISSGAGSKDNFLYAASADGSDVAIVTYDHLLPQDENVNGAIYDARVNGGFPSREASETRSCSGDACQGQPAIPPSFLSPASSTFDGRGNAKARHHRKRRHHKHRHHRKSKRKAHHSRRAAR
jgi:hypothetical protein